MNDTREHTTTEPTDNPHPEPRRDETADPSRVWTGVPFKTRSEVKEPWETVIGRVAQKRLNDTAFRIAPATLLAAAAVGWAYGETTALLLCAVVAGLFLAFAFLRIGWCIGCDQGALDHVFVTEVRAAMDERRYATRKMSIRLPQQKVGEGYLYVVEFSTGSVKVGQTEDPRRRLGNHRAEAAAFGVHVTNYWISPAHINFRDNETRLINYCAEVSDRTRKEYFHDLGYGRARQFAAALTFYSDDLGQTCVEGVWA